ncbi:GNAT family N-acetyltransferase [Hellea balneolensis]|uniref:GNAT family N-acetyltransferase n=1 Tax=Hellea balneolensis TaxID=287478 RepID=UPI0003F8ED30|nr:GNAT family N-acetyltransferase [Hellea balneolensis]
MTLIIRNVRPGDIPALIDLAAETFIDSFGNYHTPENCKAFIAQSHNERVYHAAIADPAKLLMVAERHNELLSYLYAKPTTLPVPHPLTNAHELSKIYTHRSAQSQGLGVRLLTEWEDWAESRGITDLVLGVWSENNAAQRFYMRHNYKKISEYQLTVGDVQDTDFIFHKSL